MEELELRHLAGYLPYGISIEVNFQKQKYITDSWGLKCQSDYLISEYERGIKKGLTLNQVNPILRPLSYLTNEDTAIVYDLGSIELELINIEEWTEELIHEIKTGQKFKLSQFEYLNSKHFDIHNLIEKGLAIDIYTLNEQ